MNERRTDLQTLLETLTAGDPVYFQPPESVKLTYPCIVYSRSAGDTKYASDEPYLHRLEYQVTVIDKDPDSLIRSKWHIYLDVHLIGILFLII